MSCVLAKVISKTFIVNSIQETSEIAQEISDYFVFPNCIYLHGTMGAGKTTFTAAILAALGYQGPVTSPTYNLIQEYQLENGVVYHMDLYRIEDASELEFLALEDIWNTDSMFIVEWPQNGIGYLRNADIHIEINKCPEIGHDSRQIVIR